MKRYLSLLSVLAALVVLAAIDAGAAPAEEQAGETEERLELLYLRPGDSTWWKDGSIIETQLEEMFNVELKMLPINSWDAEKLQTTLAGGTLPDVWYGWGPAPQWFEDGYIREFSKDTVLQHMPRQSKAIDEIAGFVAWDLSTNHATGQLIMVPNVSPLWGGMWLIGAREDWMANVGVTKLPETIDELEELHRRFTFGDPDQNGKDDTYGSSAYGGVAGIPRSILWPNVFGAFGASPDHWIDDGGSVIFSDVSDGYRQALQVLNRWYDEGIIDPEFTTTKEPEYYAKVYDGVVGIYYGDPDYFTLNRVKMPPSKAYEQDPDARFVILPTPKGPGGLSGSFTWGEGAIIGWGLSFGIHTSDAKMIKAMEIADATANDLELFKLARLGIEGESYDINEKGIGVPRDNADEYGANLYPFLSYNTMEIGGLLLAADDLERIQMSKETVPWIRNVINVSRLNGTVADDPRVNRSEMDTLVNQFFYKAIVGDVDLEADWDDYVQQWMDLGGTTMTAEAQKLPRIDI